MRTLSTFLKYKHIIYRPVATNLGLGCALLNFADLSYFKEEARITL